MRAEELLMYNMKYDLPYVNTYDSRYAGAGLYELEANCGHDAAMCYELGLRYTEGRGGASKSPEKAYEYYQKVLYTQRNVLALYWLGYLSLFFLPGMEKESLIYLKTADSLGEGNASWLLGYLYFERPDVVETDIQKAYTLFLRAKEHGNVSIIDRYLGRCAEQLGMKDDARRYYTMGLNRGDKVCANYLGHMYYTGDGVEKNLDYARQFFQIGLECDKEDRVDYAKMMLALMNLENGTAKQKFDAFVQLQKHSNLDELQLIMGKTFCEGISGYLEKNEDEALKHFESVPSYDRGEAFYQMAWIYLGRKDMQNHDRCILASAECDYPPAIYTVMASNKLTLMHVKNSLNEIVKEYDDKYDKASIQTVTQAAMTDPVAMYELGSRYRMGVDGVDQDWEEALTWYRRALWHQRHIGAMYRIGFYLADDKGPENALIAKEYYEYAYSHGDENSASQLGIWYEYGEGPVEQDFNKALKLYHFAKDHGHGYADANLGRIYQKMDKYDLAETYLRSYLNKNKEDSEAYLAMGDFYGEPKNPKYNEAEAIKWFTEAANRGNEAAREVLEQYERSKVPSVEELLREDNKLREGGSEKWSERMSLLSYAREIYPNNPEIVRRYIDVLCLISLGTKFFKKTEHDAESAYKGLQSVLKAFDHLRKINGMHDSMKQIYSLTVTHLADLALHKNEEGYALKLLAQADRVLAPYASVVAFDYYFKKLAELEDKANMSEAEKMKIKHGYMHNVKKEMEILSKTVEKAENWSSQSAERAIGYMLMAMCYNTSDFEPYIHVNRAKYEMYEKKAIELNPNLMN